MEVTSRDGNMVVDFYPVKTWDNKLINNRMLKVLTFRGDTVSYTHLTLPTTPYV